MSLINILLSLVTLLVLAYFYIKQKHSYWKNLNVPAVRLHYQQFINRPTNALLFKRYYDEFKGKAPYFGFFTTFRPGIMITDLDLLKNILVKDFNTFLNRGLSVIDEKNPLSGHLFNQVGTKWRNLRSKLSPTFTSGKMKYMFPTIVAIADEFKKTMHREIAKSKSMELKDLLARFTTDVIGSVAFGLECNSLEDPKSRFRHYGRLVFKMNSFERFKLVFRITFPGLAEKLGISLRRPNIINFFMDLVNQTVVYRANNNVKRNDFMELLIDLKANSNDDSFTINDMASNAFVFFLAGFETSSTAMSFALYELAQNQEIQEKARQEVKRVLKEHNGEMTYESMNDMKYLLQVMNESLRKYPPVPELFRKAETDYEEPTTGFVFKQGMRIITPVYAIHHDPEYYPKPDVFDPERFSVEEIQKRNPYTFLPFGEGPRNCIGMRFALMQARIGLATLLNNFKFTPTEQTPNRLEFDPNGLVLTSKGGLWLHVEHL